ncbi:MAG TPA: hypothetical protein VG276_22530 [Actinomycetes bacterium]|jgi:hypothetical protein|nr:hypothetical protein [Actinomycetes bacterium]
MSELPVLNDLDCCAPHAGLLVRERRGRGVGVRVYHRARPEALRALADPIVVPAPA